MRLLLMLATVAAAIGLAVPALADPPDRPRPDDPAADAAFLDSLNKAGMTYRSGSRCRRGRQDGLRHDEPRGDRKRIVVEQVDLAQSRIEHGGAMKFAALASSTYCPDYLNKSSTQDHSALPRFGVGRQLSTTIVLGTRLLPRVDSNHQPFG